MSPININISVIFSELNMQKKQKKTCNKVNYKITEQEHKQ